MKIVFMGTPDFAVPCLQALLEQVVSEKLPNPRPALLARAEAILRGKETL